MESLDLLKLKVLTVVITIGFILLATFIFTELKSASNLPQDNDVQNVQTCVTNCQTTTNIYGGGND